MPKRCWIFPYKGINWLLQPVSVCSLYWGWTANMRCRVRSIQTFVWICNGVCLHPTDGILPFREVWAGSAVCRLPHSCIRTSSMWIWFNWIIIITIRIIAASIWWRINGIILNISWNRHVTWNGKCGRILVTRETVCRRLISANGWIMLLMTSHTINHWHISYMIRQVSMVRLWQPLPNFLSWLMPMNTTWMCIPRKEMEWRCIKKEWSFSSLPDELNRLRLVSQCMELG